MGGLLSVWLVWEGLLALTLEIQFEPALSRQKGLLTHAAFTMDPSFVQPNIAHNHEI